MDVKTFISETLQQIIGGIQEAQSVPGGQAINAAMSHGSPGGNLISDGKRMFTRVDFDIAISAESSGGGRGSLQVFGIGGAEAGGERKSGYANRISFSVPVKLPDGDKGPSTGFEGELPYQQTGVV